MLGRRMEESKSDQCRSSVGEKREQSEAHGEAMWDRVANIAKLTSEIRRLSVLLRLATCKAEA